MKLLFWKQNSILSIFLLVISMTQICSLTKKKLKQDKIIAQRLSSILKTISAQSEKENEFKSELMEKLKSAESFKDEIEKKKSELENIIQNKSYKNSDEEKYLKEIEHKSKESKIMEEIENEIKKEKLKELEAFEKTVTDKINKAKEKANQSVYEMIKILNTQKKLTNYNECLSSNISSDEYINKVCQKNFNKDSERVKCQKKKSFCLMCCSSHIGLKHEEKLFQCKEKCTELIHKKK